MTKDEANASPKDEALRLALETMEAKDGWGSSIREAKERAITAIKAALEAKDEPVAWLHKETGLLRKETISSKGADWDENHWKPLYTTPPHRKPLTSEEIRSIWNDGDCYEEIAFARAIEAAHGIKG